MKKIKHPATFSNQFMPIFYEHVKNCKKILDPFAGTGKIAVLKQMGYVGQIVCNDLEPEYKTISPHAVDKWLHVDAEFINEPDIDAIVTSPTYGNRMADSHNAKDSSKRMTYTHQLGRKLSEGNTGAMQWGERYKKKHEACYKNFFNMLPTGGLLVINISNHIRKGEIVDVSGWTKDVLLSIGFTLSKQIDVPVNRLRYGANHDKRVETEQIFIFIKN